MEESQRILMDLAARASHILHDYFVKLSQYFDKDSDIPVFERYVLKQVPISCHTTSESILILVANNRIWDNEMLIRSVLEGTIKFIYLTVGSNEEREKKIDEYWNVLPIINKIKRSNRAEEIYEYLSNTEVQKNDMKFIGGVLLTEEEIQEIREKYPRKYRKELEHKWSYSEIIKDLSKQDKHKFFSGMFHGYGIGSHLIHQDADAINYLIDHNQRIPERRIAKELAHGCRQISDIMTFSILRLYAYKVLFKESVDDIYLESHIILDQDMEKYHKSFQEIEEGYLDY
ncbi:DUF5677 domain-containing protein [Paenibacillus peoriae]|uniref:DUF5677 domain-containing protein n=1 Tax=Paenibacillus peoriae TaxID=59893 RepID=UPI00096F8581|nr:DUF5677 domain-containing protein [Paenibacillus peoriae]OMF43535.1 hypothetical protein BK135_17945 [Paenibacillus peoriae]